jgi:hypothetical protein
MKAKTAKTAQKAAPTNKATVASSMKVVQKQLNRFRTDEELLFLARRIFQKEPSVLLKNHFHRVQWATLIVENGIQSKSGGYKVI